MSATPNTSSFAISSSQPGQQPVGKRVKIPDPQPFKGDPKTARTFLTKVIPIAREADLGLVATKEIIKENLNERSHQYLILASANLSDETLQGENLVQFKERIGRVIRRMENETSSRAIHAILRTDARHSLFTKTVADPPKFTHPTYTKSGYYGPAPMDIGRVRGPLTSKEKQR